MAQLLSTKNVLLATRPLAVGVLSQVDALQTFLEMDPAERTASCDVVELRLDLLNVDASDLREAMPILGLPVLLTARHPDEGGKGTPDAAGRMALIEPLLDLAALVDIELRSAPEMKPLLSRARACGVPVMGSFHDFQATPADQDLLGAIAAGETYTLDAVKLATYLNTPDDLIRLMRLVTVKRRLPLSAMGMGGLGRVSRLALAKLGSLLNYGYLGESNAPGQWPARQLKTLLADL